MTLARVRSRSPMGSPSIEWLPVGSLRPQSEQFIGLLYVPVLTFCYSSGKDPKSAAEKVDGNFIFDPNGPSARTL